MLILDIQEFLYLVLPKQGRKLKSKIVSLRSVISNKFFQNSYVDRNILEVTQYKFLSIDKKKNSRLRRTFRTLRKIDLVQPIRDRPSCICEVPSLPIAVPLPNTLGTQPKKLHSLSPKSVSSYYSV